MSNRILDLLAELREALSEDYSETVALRWWDRVQSVDLELVLDPRHSDDERAMVRNLRADVSEFMAAHRDGLNADAGRARVAITVLEGSIKRRSIGLDGWPMG